MGPGQLRAQEFVQCIQIRTYWDWSVKVIMPTAVIGVLVTAALLTKASSQVGEERKELSESEFSALDLSEVGGAFLRWGEISICATIFILLVLGVYGCRYRSCITQAGEGAVQPLEHV